jgi:DNA helicase IV
MGEELDTADPDWWEDASYEHALRFERDATVHDVEATLSRLQLGDYALVFGRMDTVDDEAIYLGRIGVRDEDHVPLVVDWRTPVAERFYRATGADPAGLKRRRHFACDGRHLVGLEDEFFSESSEGLAGPGALLDALGKRRTGKMRDIVATVQREQDLIIRAPLEGIVVVQGGPGTGKTAVALHRAAYLLFRHRARLGRRGVLVVGPNPLFLGYVDQVLPALGESLAELSTVTGLVGRVIVNGTDSPEAARVKGDVRMVQVIANAVRDRELPVTKPQTLIYDDPAIGEVVLELAAGALAHIPETVSGRRGTHNDRRLPAERIVIEALVEAYNTEVDRRAEEMSLPPGSDLKAGRATVERNLAADRQVRRLLDRVWPVLTPEQLLDDLFGSRPLLESAARGVLTAGEVASLWREWRDEPVWTDHDAPLLEEALLVLGPAPRVRSEDEDDDANDRGMEIPLFGHVVVDEAQDLSPMQLRVVARRSLGGSMTLVGDLAQATSEGAPGAWAKTLEHLPQRTEPTFAELTVNYRTPGEVMDAAARVLAAAEPYAKPPTSVRRGSSPPVFDRIAALAEHARTDEGMVAVICAASEVAQITKSLPGAIRADHGQLHGDLVVVPSRLAKGLEFDTVIVVEPAAIIDEGGLKALYVAMTRTTERLVVVHDRVLPDCLADAEAAALA